MPKMLPTTDDLVCEACLFGTLPGRLPCSAQHVRGAEGQERFRANRRPLNPCRLDGSPRGSHPPPIQGATPLMSEKRGQAAEETAYASGRRTE